MPRVLPDENDLIVWLCDDAAASTSIINTGVAGSTGDLAVKNLNPILEGQGLLSDGLWFQGSSSTRDYFSGAASIQPTFPMTLSTWVYMRSWSGHGSGTGGIVRKSYRNDNTWTTPFITMQLFITGTSGNWGATVTTSGTNKAINIGSNHPFPLNIWTHIGFTYDGATMQLWFNGMPISSLAVTGAIDYGTNGPWSLGAIPATSSSSAEQPAMILNDVRIANVVRDRDYFEKIYVNGVTI